MGAPTLKAVEVEGLDAAGEGAFLRLSSGLPVLARALESVAKAAAELGEDLVAVPAVPRSPIELEAAVADLELLEKAFAGSAEGIRARKLRALMRGLGGMEKRDAVEKVLTRERCTIIAIKATGMQVQTILVPASRGREGAKTWLKDHGYATELDEGDQYFRARQKDPGSFQEGSLRTISFGDSGIKAVVGKPKTKTSETKKYDSDQPRDEDGRWSGGMGDGSGPPDGSGAPGPISADEARRLSSADHVFGESSRKYGEKLAESRAKTALAMHRDDPGKAIAHLQSTKARARASADEEIRRDYGGKPDPETKKFFDRMVEEKHKEIDRAIELIRSGKAKTAKADDSAPNTGGDISTPTLAEQGGALVPAQGKKPKRSAPGPDYPAEQPGPLPLYRELNLGTEVAFTMRDPSAKGSGTSLGLALASSNGPPPPDMPDPKKKPDGKHLFGADGESEGTGGGMVTSSVSMRKDGPADEARDEHGRWTSGGGASGTGEASYREHLLGALRGHYHRDDFDFERAKEATVDELETEVREAGLHSALRTSKAEKAGPADEPRDEHGRWTTGGPGLGSDQKIVGAHMRRGYLEGLRQIREQRLTPAQAHEQFVHMKANAAGPHDAAEDVQHQQGAMQALREFARRAARTQKGDFADRLALAIDDLFSLENEDEVAKRVRAEMPQIPTEKVQEFVTFMRGRGVAVEPTTVKASALCASQDDLNKAKVDRIKAKGLGELLKGPPLLTAHGDGSESAILDGHHRAAAIAELDPNADVPCLDVACSIDEAIAHALEFPGAERRGINDGVMKMRIIAKAAAPNESEGEQRTVFGIVLEPEVVDSQGDIYDEDEIRESAWRFAERYQHFGLMHRQVVPGIVLLETYLAPVDFEIKDRRGQAQKIRKGTWLLRVRVTDDSIWQAVKDGRLDGFSIGGSAVRQPLKESKKRPAA